MEHIKLLNAYYIKLGQNGIWENSSFSDSKLRIGWFHQKLSDINSCKWDIIRKELAQELTNKGTVTRDINALRLICESTSEDVWITFSKSRMWWCRVGSSTIKEDKISKYREIIDQWLDKDIHGHQLFINQVPGELSKIQGFRGTICRVKEIDTLQRLLNDDPSPEYQNIHEAREVLVKSVEEGLRKLHWKDFETFVDLIFRASGWRRLSMLGETMKFADIELEDPITNDKYQVQIKSTATLNEFKSYLYQFDGQGYRKLYFVVHSPDHKLENSANNRADVELVLPGKLSQMAVDLGMVEWLMHRIK